MQPFKRHTGQAVPLDRANVDTDAIIPKQFLKRIERTGYGPFLFFDWRYTPDGKENPQFILNRPGYREGTILLAGPNFGSGSSREHAPWALQQFGFQAIIAPSFADIFYNNCFENGLLPVTLPEQTVADLIKRARPGYELTVDLEKQTVSDKEGFEVRFDIDPFRRHLLLNGLDSIGLTLQHGDKIKAYEARMAARRA
jgi:3-isopropylmalate/(R)-2-methylmalate dehydratase small subunit